jgi:hypothetical protein
MTLATDMYWTGLHPNTGKPLTVVTTEHEKRLQRSLLHPDDPAWTGLAREARRKAGGAPAPAKAPKKPLPRRLQRGRGPR